MALAEINDFTCETGLNEHYYFPCCPKQIERNPLKTYFGNLKVGAIFAYNDDYPRLTILEFAMIKDSSAILVMCERESLVCEREGFKPWLIAEITFKNGFYAYSKLGTYFEIDEANKVFCIEQGLELSNLNN